MAKVTSLEEAVSVVQDGSHIGLTGFAITRNNVAVAHALLRAGRRDLEVSQVVAGLETDLLAAGGCVRRLAYSGGSLDRFGRLSAVNRAISAGQIDVAEYSSLALTLRFLAGSLGLPYLPAQTMLGSDLLPPLVEAGAAVIGEDPFTGGPIVKLAPLRPEIVFVHVDAADPEGNSIIAGPTWSIRETAFAGRHVAVVCEELVPAGSIDPNRVLIPASIVNTVTVVPNGARPTAVQGRYDYDRNELINYAAASRDGGAALDEYLDRHVRNVGRFDEYLDLVGATA